MEFDHFTIRRKGNDYFAIFDNCCEEITSAKSLNKAAKKTKLLEMGFNIGINYRGY